MIFVAGSMTAGDDWLEHRGPTGQGVSEVKAAPLNWTKSENMKWRKELPGKAWSTPVVKDGRIYLTNATEENWGISLRALCLDLETSKIIWDREVFKFKGDVIMHKKNSHASSTPVIEDDRIYLHFGYQGTACLSLDGKRLWENRNLYYDPTHGNGGSPAIIKNMLVFHCDGEEETFITALDKMTGEQLWKTDRKTIQSKKFSFGTPLLIEAGGKEQIISQASGAVFSYDLKGNEIWKFRYDGFSVVPKPLYKNGLVYISSGYARAKLYVIDPTGTGDVTESHLKWMTDKDVPNNPSLLSIGDELYLQSDKGTISCLDAKTGEVHYQKKRLIRTSSASPVYAANKIYFTDERGTTLVIAPGKEFKLLATNDIEEPVLASMAIVDEKLLLRSEFALYCIE